MVFVYRFGICSNKIIRDPYSVSSSSKDYFLSVVNELTGNIVKPENFNYMKCASFTVTMSNSLQCLQNRFYKEEAIKEIMLLKNGKSGK